MKDRWYHHIYTVEGEENLTKNTDSQWLEV